MTHFTAEVWISSENIIALLTHKEPSKAKQAANSDHIQFIAILFCISNMAL